MTGGDARSPGVADGHADGSDCRNNLVGRGRGPSSDPNRIGITTGCHTCLWSRHSIAVECNRPVARQRSAGQRRARLQSDGLKRQNVALEDRIRPQRCGGAGLPKHILCLRAARQNNLSTPQGCKSGSNLEDEYGVRVPLGVERHVTCR